MIQKHMNIREILQIIENGNTSGNEISPQIIDWANVKLTNGLFNIYTF